MLQYDIFTFLIVIVLFFLFMLNIRAYRRRVHTKKYKALQIAEIHKSYFREVDYSRFEYCWPKFCRITGTKEAYLYLDEVLPVLAKFFPIDDIFYENLEAFLGQSDGDISKITVRQLFEIYLKRGCP